MSSFWAEKISKAIGPDRKLPPPTISQTPAEPEQPALDEYLVKARESIPNVQGVTAEERFGGTMEFIRRTRDPEGRLVESKISVPQRDSSDITVRQGNRSWETNSRQVQTDSGLFGSSTPQERAAAYRQAARDGRYNTFGDDKGTMYGSATPWERAAMLSDAISAGDFTEAGHGDGGWFDPTSPRN